MPITKTASREPWNTVSNGDFTIPPHYSPEIVSLDVNIHHRGGLLISESHRIEIDGAFHARYDQPIVVPVPIGPANALRGKKVRVITTVTKSTYPDIAIENGELVEGFPVEAENVFSASVSSNIIELSRIKGTYPKKVLEVFLTDYLIS